MSEILVGEWKETPRFVVIQARPDDLNEVLNEYQRYTVKGTHLLPETDYDYPRILIVLELK